MPGEYRDHIHMGGQDAGEANVFDVVDGGAIPGADSIRQLRRLHAAAVTVVTTHDERGFRGVTVSAFCVVSLDPPSVMISLGRDSAATTAVITSGSFAVSVLADTQEFLADQFAGRAPQVNPRFAGVKHRRSANGNPILEDGLAWFDCAVTSRLDAGDHVVIFGAVREAGHGNGAEPLLYFDGKYGTLGAGY